VLSEIRALRRTQEEILGLLRGREAAAPSDALDGDLAFGTPEESPGTEPPPIRSRRRKTVLLVDDDEATRQAAVVALTQAEVPTRAFADGTGAVAAIVAEKPDVIILELGLAGDMAGRDVVNVVKSTMEWVDIPIVLYTREPVASQKEARQIHGADEVVSKGPGSPAALVQRVIAIFRRG
jgi:CheY-like chemotaxis protein